MTEDEQRPPGAGIALCPRQLGPRPEGQAVVTVRVLLLGGFQAVVDGAAVPQSAWARRHTAALVKVLALTDGRRLHREQALDLLWPGVEPGVAAPRLHQAA